MTTFNTSIPICCTDGTWTILQDCGSAAGCEFTLGECSSCRKQWMHVWSTIAQTEAYQEIQKADVAEILNAPPGPARKKFLSHWWEEKI